jgi:hypothetical protein
MENVVDAYLNAPDEEGGYLKRSGGTMAGPITTPDDNAVGVNIGNDARFSDRNYANTVFVEGIQNNDRGYINFGQSGGNPLGAISGGNLTWRGNRVWDAGAIPYETGTFTPTLYGTGTAGVFTYSWREGRYTRIGNRVWADISIGISAVSIAAEGGIRIGNLPYAAKNAGTYRAIPTILTHYISWGSGATHLSGSLGAGGTYISVYGASNNGPVVEGGASSIGAGEFVMVSISYECD